MTTTAKGVISALALLAWIAGALAIASSSGYLDTVKDRAAMLRGEQQTKTREVRHSRAKQGEARSARRAPRKESSSFEKGARRAPGAAWRAIRAPLLILFLLVVGWAGIRLHHRRVRLDRMRRWEIQLSREDTASPFQRQMMFSEWAAVLSERWWRRIVFGQPSVALGIHNVKGEQRFTIACEPDHMKPLLGKLRSRYPDVRVQEIGGTPAWTDKIVLLKKRRPFMYPLQTLKDDEYLATESIVSTMAELEEEVSVEMVLTPAPALFEDIARALYKRRERSLNRADRGDPDELGVDSVVEEKESKAALESQGRALFWTDIRVFARRRATAKHVAAPLIGARSENTLRVSYPLLRAGIYRRRIASAANNPLPSWRRGVLSASELATLWALPRQRVRGARLHRSSLRRAPAPPQIDTDRGRALMVDESGRRVGLHPQDRKYGLLVVGGQGVGKSTQLLRAAAIDAQDRSKALVFLNPKDNTGRNLLELIPKDRTVHYLDVAHPQFGINPLQIDAPPGAIADMLVASFRETHGEGAVMAASDSFLRFAAMAVCAVEQTPTLWHMQELLSPRRVDYRKRTVERLRRIPGMTEAALYWGTTFPEMWMDGRTQMTPALNAPRNKIERLISTPSVDMVLRHPCELDISRVIRERGVLVVDGAMGAVGADNTTLIMQMVIHLIDQAFKRQQGLPEHERVRVSLIMDEAYTLLVPSYAEMLALHRSSGLEPTMSLHFDQQIANRILQVGVKSLQRSVSVYALGDAKLAREYSDFLQEVYTDAIRAGKEDRERLTFGPEDITHLPVFWAISSWIAGGARRAAFVAKTLRVDDLAIAQLVEHHLDAQAARGAFWPEVLPAPEGIGGQEDARASVSFDSEDSPVASGDETQGEAVTARRIERESDAIPSSEVSIERTTSKSGSDGTQEPTPAEDASLEREGEESVAGDDVPATYAAVHRDDAFGILMENRGDTTEKVHVDPEQRDLEILAALHRYRWLLTSQLKEEWWPDKGHLTAKRRLRQLFTAGLVSRFRLRVPVGSHEHIYELTRAGFDLAKRHHGPDGPYIAQGGRWKERTVSDHRPVHHDLQVNAWALCYRRLVGGLVTEWLGPEQGQIEVPTVMVGGRPRRIELSDVDFGDYSNVEGLKLDKFRPLVPDATLRMDLPHRSRRFDLLVELDRTRRPAANFDKFRRYDSLITAWWRRIRSYESMGEPPAVVFVCSDEDQARSFMEAADRDVVGRLADPTKPEAQWRYPGRERMLFADERDVHGGSLRSWMLPRAPSESGRTGDVAIRQVRLPGPKFEVAV